ncbi:DUF6919 domain-containing protein [Streptomyces sp. NPDC055189]
MKSRADVRGRHAARSLEDPGVLTADRLEGTPVGHPNGHNGGSGQETGPPAPVLREKSGGGFLTEGSRPAPDRQVLFGILYVLHTDIQRKHLSRELAAPA